ncbi:MAG: SpoIID/LytB domain-containing protein [Sumerlaeia bacterium]
MTTLTLPLKKDDPILATEPPVRIGIILEQDATTEIPVMLPEGTTVRLGEGAPVPVSGAAKIGVKSPTELTLVLADGAQPATGALLTLAHPDSTAHPVEVQGVVAGRGFHWEKRVTIRYSGELEFRVQNGAIVMVNTLPLEDYLLGVVTSEMSGECPIAYIKAQAVAARAWLLAQPRPPHPGQPFLWCNDDCCQRYQGVDGWNDRARQGIDECRGEVLITASGALCDARYSKSTGGISEDAHSVWPEDIEGLVAIPDAPKGSEVEHFFPVTDDNIVEYLTGDWLRGTDCFASPNVVSEDSITKYLGRVDEAGEYFRWRVPLTHAQLAESLTNRGGLKDIGRITDLVPLSRGRSGRLEQLRVEWKTPSGESREAVIQSEYNIRAAMSSKFLFSSCFLIEDIARGSDGAIESLTLVGGGWGHGAGLCQIGGLGRALKGQDYKTILLHYFQGVTLEKLYA